MSMVENAIERLYTQFLLHDLIGKIVPGSIVLCSIALLISGTLAKLLKISNSVPLVFWGLGIGTAWLIGFVLQSWREDMQPKNDDAQSRYKKRIEAYSTATTYAQQQLNRFWLVHDATANGSSAFLVSGAILAVLPARMVYQYFLEDTPSATPNDIFGSGFVCAACFLFWFRLRHLSRAYGKKHKDFLSVLALPPDDTSSEGRRPV